ncbi:c-type cytochrome [Polaromonas hydrogenivorans]|uniref:C-type cytochrome n=1 Tax=Polaromonas hydrogenivorans TaxID=335476 RepID=A0AAU7LM40_9BURK
MKPITMAQASALLAFAGWTQVQAQPMDALQVRSLAASCAACHGTQGMAQSGMASLAGLNKDALLQTMLDFKTGKKPATLMQQIAKGYSDEQLAALAAYFSSAR